MGIPNLLPQLKSIMDPRHIADYAGQRVGIDAYAWYRTRVMLHRSAYTCAQELCLGQPSTKWLEWCLGRCQLLRHHGVLPVLVFDGGRLPEKDKTEKGRRDSRERNRAKAMELLAGGDNAGAYKMFQKAIEITPSIARQLMVELRKHRFEFINAPYEADAQLAYLSHTGYIASVITEDSDMLVFGCTRVLFKMDHLGNGSEMRLKNLGANADLDFSNWTHDMFQQMCILAGCDYLDSLPNVGIKKAYTYISQFRSWERAIRRIRLDGKTKVPSTYDRDFELALLTFRHQRVYDPATKKLVHLTPTDEAFAERFADTSFLGPALPDDVACAIAEGLIDPETRLPFAAAVVNPPTTLSMAAPSHGARVPSFAQAMATPPARASTSHQPTISGWAKKHSTASHHAQPAAAPIEFAMRRQAGGAPSAVASALSHTHRRVIETCGALLDSSDAVLAAASIPPSLRQDFRPPRKHDPSLRDLTNAPNASPAMTKNATATTTRPMNRHADRTRMLDQYVASGFVRRRSSGVDVDLVDDDDAGFSHEDAAAELDMEAAADVDEDEEAKAGPSVLQPSLMRKPRMNFLSRSSTGLLPSSRAASNTVASVTRAAFASPPVQPRTRLAPPTAVPIDFYSPPAALPSPSPPPPQVLPVAATFSSKYFVARSTPAATAATTTPVPSAWRPAKSASHSARTHHHATPATAAATIPDASSFLFAPSSVHTPATYARADEEEDDDDEGRIDIEIPEDSAEEEEDALAVHLRRRTGLKRAASSGAQTAASNLKRFRSPLVNPRGRMTLQVSPVISTFTDPDPITEEEEVEPTPSPPPAATTSLFSQVRRATANARATWNDEVRSETPSPPQSSPSPGPIAVSLARHQSASTPFRQLTVQPRSTSLVPPLPSTSATRTRYFDTIDMTFSSQPTDATPPSPTPSPTTADLSPSPSPPVSQPFAGPYAAAGFSSQPSDDDDLEEVEEETRTTFL